MEILRNHHFKILNNHFRFDRMNAVSFSVILDHYVTFTQNQFKYQHYGIVEVIANV